MSSKTSELATTKKETTALNTNISRGGFFAQMAQKNEEELQGTLSPYNLRNNCKFGVWMTGAGVQKGEEIKIILLEAIPYYGALGKTAPTRWSQVWFVAAPTETEIPQNYLCVTYVKTIGLESLKQTTIDIFHETNEHPLDYVCHPKFKPEVNKDGDQYFSLGFKFVKDEIDWTKYQQKRAMLEKFLDQINNFEIDLADLTLPDTMVNLRKVPNLEDAEMLVAEAIAAQKEKNNNK